MLSILWAFQIFDCYIAGSKIEVYTDHLPLKCIFTNSTKLNGRLMRWSLQLVNYDFEIIYKEGPKNTAADCISRLENLGNGPSIRTRSALQDYLDMPVTYDIESAKQIGNINVI